jgi:hypothetical protein
MQLIFSSLAETWVFFFLLGLLFILGSFTVLRQVITLKIATFGIVAFWMPLFAAGFYAAQAFLGREILTSLLLAAIQVFLFLVPCYCLARGCDRLDLLSSRQLLRASAIILSSSLCLGLFVTFLASMVDVQSGLENSLLTEAPWFNRIIYLNTLLIVPGLVVAGRFFACTGKQQSEIFLVCSLVLFPVFASTSKAPFFQLIFFLVGYFTHPKVSMGFGFTRILAFLIAGLLLIFFFNTYFLPRTANRYNISEAQALDLSFARIALNNDTRAGVYLIPRPQVGVPKLLVESIRGPLSVFGFEYQDEPLGFIATDGFYANNAGGNSSISAILHFYSPVHELPLWGLAFYGVFFAAFRLALALSPSGGKYFIYLSFLPIITLFSQDFNGFIGTLPLGLVVIFVFSRALARPCRPL